MKTILMLNITITIQILDLSDCKEDLRGRVSTWSFWCRIQWWATGCEEKFSSSFCCRWPWWILMIVKCRGSIDSWEKFITYLLFLIMFYDSTNHVYSKFENLFELTKNSTSASLLLLQRCSRQWRCFFWMNLSMMMC